ncbi:MAG: glycogen synthase GlgA [Lachnospiraceae bacterium]|nr:glycogen synthase GlgA [Lachnospiraceae bacterium]
MKKKILFAASECVPFMKTGGLADVAGALPKEFDPKKWDIRVVMPCYSCISEEYLKKMKYVTHFHTSVGGLLPKEYVGIMTLELDGITYYFIDNKSMFGGMKPYGDPYGDIRKFCYFSKAVLSILPSVDFKPDIIHCHDWQTGLIPVYLKTEFAGSDFYKDIKSIMTIHNLRFQGIWDIETMKGLTGLPDELFTADKLEFNGDANMLKGGIAYADYVTTVSETYAEEIKTWEYGEGLDGLLRAREDTVCGILNGIDYKEYDPMTDSYLVSPYSVEDFRKKKWKNKTKLQEELSLPVDKSKYMIGMITRLTDQKGLDLIQYVIDYMTDEKTQFVVIGTGDPRYEDMFRYHESLQSERICAKITYSDELAHKLYAASDAFLMPSRFEPCGLSQLIALRYGSVPIVRETGGLKDTVEPLNEYENTGNGFSFGPYDARDMLKIINYSKEIYFGKKAMWNKIAERGMRCDYSWHTSREKYEALYSRLIGK